MAHLDAILIARSPVLGREAYRVLWYLTTNVEFTRFSIINIAQISAELGLRSQAVSRALRSLIEVGILERGPRVGRRNSFRFAAAAADRRANDTGPIVN